MDVAYFFLERIAFIRQFYDAASSVFVEKKRKIEAEEEPYVPPYSEDGEPPFLSEWLEANESLNVLGNSCISMLSASLHLYLRTWESRLGKPKGHPFKSDFDKGWVNGYRAYFAACFGIRFEDSGVDLSLLEEIVLARNRIQHPDTITSHRASYSDKDLEKLPNAFFVDETERGLFSDADEKEKVWLFAPTVYVTKEKFDLVMAEIEKFSAWLETEISNR